MLFYVFYRLSFVVCLFCDVCCGLLLCWFVVVVRSCIIGFLFVVCVMFCLGWLGGLSCLFVCLLGCFVCLFVVLFVGVCLVPMKQQ